MTKSSRLFEVFSRALDIPLAEVSLELKYNTIAQWDSTAHMVLIAEIEDEFGVLLDTDDIIDMSSVEKAQEILAKYDVTL